MRIIGGKSNALLCDDVCLYLNKEKNIKTNLVDTLVNTFPDGETRIEINENLRNKNIYVIQSLSYPVNENLMELMIILDVLKRCDVKNITVIIPYYGYSRQDKKSKARTPISAKLIADMLQIHNIKRIISIDLHSPQIQGFFNIPVDNLYSSIIFLPYMKNIAKNDIVTCISPDSGGLPRVTHFTEKLNSCMSFCYKHRDNPGEVSKMKLIGNVENKTCFLIDDMCDSGGTLIKAASILKNNGAKKVIAFFTHAVLSNNAIDKLSNSEIDHIYTTDTITPKKELLKNNKFNIIGVAPMIGETIKRLEEGHSLSEMFI